MKGKKHIAYYKFLEPFFKNGNDIEIQKAKALWRRKYKAEWRRNNRKENKEITVPWSKDELGILKVEAGRHKLSNTRFIKKAVIAYMHNRYIVPNQNEVNKMIQLLALTYNSIEEMQNENRLSTNLTNKLQTKIDELEHDIRIAVFSPKTIEQVLSEVLKATPVIKEQLIQFIETIV